MKCPTKWLSLSSACATAVLVNLHPCISELLSFDALCSSPLLLCYSSKCFTMITMVHSKVHHEQHPPRKPSQNTPKQHSTQKNRVWNNTSVASTSASPQPAPVVRSKTAFDPQHRARHRCETDAWDLNVFTPSECRLTVSSESPEAAGATRPTDHGPLEATAAGGDGRILTHLARLSEPPVTFQPLHPERRRQTSDNSPWQLTAISRRAHRLESEETAPSITPLTVDV